MAQAKASETISRKGAGIQSCRAPQFLNNKKMSCESAAIIQIIRANGSLLFDPEKLALSTCYAIRDLLKSGAVTNQNNTLTLAQHA
jgi:hypothetical protein